MACPNYEKRCKELAKLYPEAFKNAHTGNAHTEDFIRLVAADLHATDPNVGLNGKRGNPTDISDDALNILDPIDGPGHTPSGAKCWVVDIIRNAGASNAEVVWNAYDDPIASTGANVDPNAPPTPIEPPVPVVPTFPYPDEPTTVKAYQDRVKATYAEAKRSFPDPNDDDAFRHFTRYGFSCHEMPEPEASNKHIAELRAELGLKPA